jgi:hypothetical protein
VAVNNGAAMSADNPWLTIPLADYEAHMALPQVGQAQLLADLFAAELRERSPSSVAVLGCAGGNGFEHAPAALRVVGVLERICGWLTPCGTLTTVLQLASAESREITPSPYTSLARLTPRLRLVSPERLVRLAERSGLRASDARTVTATGGKRFAVQSFARG